MTNTKQNTRTDATKANPNAVSVRIEPKTMSKAKFQRRHDFRIGKQPAYVDGDRSELNRHLMELRPLPEIQRENEALRRRAGRTRKMKSNAAVVTAGIITFGHKAQGVFNALPQDVQDRAFTELAHGIAARMNTSLEALVVHLDETAIHAHFMMRAYNEDGEPISNATRLGDMSALQDLAAEVMKRFAPEIERGRKKQERLKAGANYQDTIHKTVKQLHEGLPREILVKKQQIQDLDNEIIARQTSVANDEKRVAALEERDALNEREKKRLGVYRVRIAKKLAKLNDVERVHVELSEALKEREELIAHVEQRNRDYATELKQREAYAETATAQAELASIEYATGIAAVEAIVEEMTNDTIQETPDELILKNPALSVVSTRWTDLRI